MAIHDVGRDEGCNELIKDLNVSEDTDFNLKKKKLKQSTCDKNSIKLVLVVDIACSNGLNHSKRMRIFRKIKQR